MKEIQFSVTLNMSLVLEEKTANISIRNVDLKPAVITLPVRVMLADEAKTEPRERPKLYKIILETAKQYVVKSGNKEFTAAHLYRLAKDKYPDLKRNSFSASVIGCTPNHPSWKHYTLRKDYFEYLGSGKYRLKESYVK